MVPTRRWRASAIRKRDSRPSRSNAIAAGLKLVDCPIRHLGTEMAQEIYGKIEQHLLASGVEILFHHACEDLLIEDGVCRGVLVSDAFHPEQTQRISADTVVVAAGRKGADWLESVCEKHGVAHQPGTVDIGVRVEVRNEVMEEVNNVLYESKLIGYPPPFENKVRLSAKTQADLSRRKTMTTI